MIKKHSYWISGQYQIHESDTRYTIFEESTVQHPTLGTLTKTHLVAYFYKSTLNNMTEAEIFQKLTVDELFALVMEIRECK